MLVIFVLALCAGVWHYRARDYFLWCAAAGFCLLVSQFMSMASDNPSTSELIGLDIVGVVSGNLTDANSPVDFIRAAFLLGFAYSLYRAVKAGWLARTRAAGASVNVMGREGATRPARKMVETAGILLIAIVWTVTTRPSPGEGGNQQLLPAPTERSIEQKIAEAAKRINADAPHAVNARTVLERATASGRTLTYHYRLDATAEQRDEILAIGRSHVLISACESSLRSDLRRGASIAYSYAGIDFNDAVLVTVDEDACLARRNSPISAPPIGAARHSVTERAGPTAV